MRRSTNGSGGERHKRTRRQRTLQIPKHGPKRRKRGNYNDSKGIIKEHTSIEQRPEIVDERSRLGDAEIDLMVGMAYKSALVVITDLATLLTRLKKINSQHARLTERAIEEILTRLLKAFIKTVTVNNDKMFANHQSLARKLNANVYFTRPYTSQDKRIKVITSSISTPPPGLQTLLQY